MTKTEDICSLHSPRKEVTSCIQLLQFVRAQVKLVSSKKESLESLINHESIRTKRGIFNGLGTAWKWLTGSLDADDANYYDHVIQQTEKTDKNVQLLLKDQIQVIKSTISNFNDSMKTLKFNELILNENINQLNRFGSAITNKTVELEKSNIVNNHLSLLTYLINEINQQYDVLIDAVLFAKINILHPAVITPIQMISTLRNNTKLLTEGKSFPFPLDDANIIKLIEISKLSVYYNNYRMVFVIQIPLTNNEIFSLYNLIPLPVLHKINHTYIYIQPEFQYLALAENKAHFAQLNTLDNCKQIMKNEYICSNQEIYSTMDAPRCEISLITSFNQNLPNSCNTRIIKGSVKIWHPLKHNNQWIYVLSDPTILTILCPNISLKDEVIQNIGILQLNQGCKAYSQHIQLIATSQISSEYENIMPSIPIIEDDCCTEKRLNSTLESYLLQPVHFSNIRLDELKVTSHKLDSINAKIDENLNQPHHYKYASWFSIISSVLITIIGILLTYKFLKCIGFIALMRRICKNNAKDDNEGCLVRIYNQCHSRNNTSTIRMQEIEDSSDVCEVEASAPPTYKDHGYSKAITRSMVRERERRNVHSPSRPLFDDN